MKNLRDPITENLVLLGDYSGCNCYKASTSMTTTKSWFLPSENARQALLGDHLTTLYCIEMCRKMVTDTSRFKNYAEGFCI